MQFLLPILGALIVIALGWRSPIWLAWIRPIAVADYFTGDGVEGVVVEIGLFGTRLRSTSGLFVFTNNNKLWNGAITNHTRRENAKPQLITSRNAP